MIALENASILRTNNIEESNLISHGISVHLAHVPSLIGFFDIFYPKHPLASLHVRYGHSMILGDHVRLYR